MKMTATVVFIGLSICAGALRAQQRTGPPPRAALIQLSESIEDLARTSSPAVVQISVRGLGPVEEGEAKQAGFVAEQNATGSGVILDPAGYIVTNAHVVKDARTINVSLLNPSAGTGPGDHRHLAAKLVGLDRETDLAVVKIEAQGLPSLRFADSSALKQGQMVMAIGSPLGLDNSVTVGFVSAPVRYLDPGTPISYVQTDAAINPGNSGGALVDLEGRLVGINTMIMTRSGGSEGLGFAIPSNLVRQVYEGIRQDGRIHRGAIGVIPQDITPTLASALGLGRDSGVILADIVADGAAEAAGLQQGDIVLAVDEKPLRESRDLIAAVFQRKFGEQIKLDVLRGQQKSTITVAVLQRPRSPGDLVDLASRDANLVRRLGILALTVDEKVTPVLPDLRRLYGVAVAAISLEFAALNPGLLAGDVIYEVNGTRVASLEELRAELDTKKAGAPIALLIERSGQLRYVSFQLE